ncbi:MAG: HAMP domain-containing sensor histidine kinase [Phycisphaerae bacterium]
MAGEQHIPKKRWITAATAIIVLAGVLVCFALFFAVRQSNALALLRIAAAQHEALQFKLAATRNIRDGAATFLSRAAGHYQAGRRQDPFSGEREDSWLGDLFIWDGQVLTRWGAADSVGQVPAADAELIRLIEDRFRHRLGASASATQGRLPFMTDLFRSRSVVWAYLILGRSGSTEPFLAAVQIELNRLRSDFLENHFAASGKLDIVHKSRLRQTYWFQPLSEALPWLIVPAPDFVNAQLGTAHTRIIVFVAVAVVFFLVLVAMVWKLVRLVRREVALSQLKSNFVADVSHELKTPLALIRMFGEMLSENRVPSEQKKRDYYAIITRESTRLAQLIENILDFSRIEAGQKHYQMQPIDVGSVVSNTYDNYRVNLDEQGFEHHLTVVDDLPAVHADPDAIAQAVVNLLGNAVKYSHEEKRLEIDVQRETRRGKHGVLISIADCGIGISPEDRAHLFDGFFRAADDRVRRTRGTGLGLSVVKHIVQAHGGSIDVESRLVKGSVFRIFLPQSASPADHER